MLNIYNGNQTYNNIKLRFKRSPQTFEQATKHNNFAYWLTQEDIADIARIEYQNFASLQVDSSDFEIVGSIAQLFQHLRAIKAKVNDYGLRSSRSTLILNLYEAHWVSLVIAFNNSNYMGYYIDSKGDSVPVELAEIIRLFDIELITLSDLKVIFYQQTDEYNCALWALENARDINRMLNENKPYSWLVNLLKKIRDSDYFIVMRQQFSGKLQLDEERIARFYNKLSGSFQLENERSLLSKPLKPFSSEEFAELSSGFVEAFINECLNQFALAKLVAKGEPLTIEAFKQELKTTFVLALFGTAMAREVIGSIAPMTQFLRGVASKVYLPRSKAQKTVRIFSGIQIPNFNIVLAEAALKIFYSYEAQFIQVTDKAGDKMAMEKLAEDAAVRFINYFIQEESSIAINSESIARAILLGKSDVYFSPNLKQARLRLQGKSLQDKYGNKINTANLYENTGLVVFNGDVKRFYKKKGKSNGAEYGYRRLLREETSYSQRLDFSDYEEVKNFVQETSLQSYSRSYAYVFQELAITNQALDIINKINAKHTVSSPENLREKKSLLFDLRAPVNNFTGRKAVLETLHSRLLADKTTAIIESLRSLSISASDARLISSSSSSTSISGLGGIGKTQLALRYAALYAGYYDNNVIWINSETKLDLETSFLKLAKLLQLKILDNYSDTKDITLIASEVYDYFSDRKSLFIFDNVPDYRSIEFILPQVMLGTKPHILITSRYTNWKNAAQVVDLNVFDEEESLEFIKNELQLTETYEPQIKELNRLLQGLPLALQQAAAYIKNRREIESFGIQDYIELFKTKAYKLDLLDFNFSISENDPYTKTVLTAWEISLEKINAHLYGDVAIEILEMMAYLCPDSISIGIFLKPFNFNILISAINLLERYSLISKTNQVGKFTIHRLVQKVIDIRLEKDFLKFRATVRRVNLLVREHHGISIELKRHYAHFILRTYNRSITGALLNKSPSFINIFVLEENDLENLYYFFDLARHEFTKAQYADFLAKGLLFYAKKGHTFFVDYIISYLHQLEQENVLSKEAISRSLNFNRFLDENNFSLKRYSNVQEKRKRQALCIWSVLKYIKELGANSVDELVGCSSHLRGKRSAKNCLLEQVVNEKRRHLQTLSATARLITSGLFAKSMLSAVARGDFDSIAINLSFLIGSAGLEKIANRVLATGEILIASTETLEKGLGKTMVVASPFVAKGVSLLFAWQLLKDIQAFRQGKQGLLPNIVLNGVIVSVDGLEVAVKAAEYIGWISEVAAFIGPVGEGVTVLTWLTVEAYQTRKQLVEIEKLVHLSKSQAMIESARAFLGFSPSNYIPIKASNNQRVQEGIAFLKRHPDIKRYVFPAIYSIQEGLFNNSIVDLDQKYVFTPDDAVPDNPSEGSLICLAKKFRLDSVELPVVSVADEVFFAVYPLLQPGDINSYRCEGAIGIEYDENRTNNLTLIVLGEGCDSAKVTSDTPSFFIVTNGEKSFRADYANFFLEGDNVTGFLEGLKGSNSLSFATEHACDVLDRSARFCGQKNCSLYSNDCDSKTSLQLININQIHGRENKQDVFFATKTMKRIDGYGGGFSASTSDYIVVSNSSEQDLEIVLRRNTFIFFELNHNISSLTYYVPQNETGDSVLYYPFSQQIKNRVFFDCMLTDLEKIIVEPDRITFSLYGVDPSVQAFTLYMLDYGLKPNHTRTSSVHQNNYYSLQDGTEIRVFNNNTLYAKQRTTKSVEMLLASYVPIASRLNMVFSIESTHGNETELVLIGSHKSEILNTDPRFKNHLISHGADDINVIHYSNDATSLTALPTITLYDYDNGDVHSEEARGDSESDYASIDTLDLEPLFSAVKGICPNATVFPHITENENDLRVDFNTNYTGSVGQCVDSNHSWSMVTIILKNALAGWYANLDVLLQGQHPLHISTEEGRWSLTTDPLLIDNSKEIVILTQHDLKNNEVILIRDIDIHHFTFWRYNETDLLFTNLNHNETEFGFFSLLFTGFYKVPEMQARVLSLLLTCANEQIILQNYTESIFNAAAFKLSEEAQQIDGSAKNRSTRSSVNAIQREIPHARGLSAPPFSDGWQSTLTVAGGILGSFVTMFGFLWLRRYLGQRRTFTQIAEPVVALPLLSQPIQTKETIITPVPFINQRISFFNKSNMFLKSENFSFKEGAIAEQKAGIGYASFSLFKYLLGFFDKKAVKRMNKMEQLLNTHFETAPNDNNTVAKFNCSQIFTFRCSSFPSSRADVSPRKLLTFIK